jgi:thiol-disulfide isomerase/thioredoxin
MHNDFLSPTSVACVGRRFISFIPVFLMFSIPLWARADSFDAKAPAVATTHAGIYTVHGENLPFKEGTAELLIVPPTADLSRKMLSPIKERVKDGAFSLTGTTDQVLFATMAFEWTNEKGVHQSASAPMLLEPAIYRTEFHPENIFTVRGGDYNEKRFGYEHSPANIDISVKLAAAERESAIGVDPTDEAAVKKAQKPVAALEPERVRNEKAMAAYEHSILSANGDPLLKLFTLMGTIDPVYYSHSSAAKEHMVDDLEKQLGPHPLIARLRASMAKSQARVKAAHRFEVGSPYENMTLRDADGGVHALSDVVASNRLVLLDFWASGCSGCRAEFPFLRKLYKEFRGRGFEIYAVSLDEDETNWTLALTQDKKKGEIPWINVLSKSFDSPPAKAYGVRGIPTNFLLSRDGKIVGKDLYQWDLDRKVRTEIGNMEHRRGG